MGLRVDKTIFYMKKLFLFLTVISFALCMGSCEKDDDDGKDPDNERLSGWPAFSKGQFNLNGVPYNIDVNRTRFSFGMPTSKLYLESVDGKEMTIRIDGVDLGTNTETQQIYEYREMYFGEYSYKPNGWAVDRFFYEKGDRVYTFRNLVLTTPDGRQFRMSGNYSFYR